MLKKWKLIKSNAVFKSKWLSVLNNTYKLPEGTIAKDYYHLERPDYVTIIAVNKKGEILIEQQYRRGVDEVLYELPAGWIKENETPVEAAKRELLEETGFVGTARSSVVLYTNPGFSAMKAYLVIIKINESRDKKLEKDEAISFSFYSMNKMKNLIEKNQIRDMVSVAALCHYLLFNLKL